MGWLKESLNIYTVGVAVISCAWLYYRYQTNLKSKRQRKLAKEKSFRLPQWAISRQKELEPPVLTAAQIAALYNRKPPAIWNNVLVFPDNLPGQVDSSLKQLQFYIKQARTSIYLCMYVCSNYTLSNAVRKRHDDGLIIRCLSEFDTWTAHNNKGIIDLAHRGVDVRLNRNGFLMHNKFVIIDEEAVITGSLNWTRQGVESNNENVMITIDPRIVSKYLKEFNRLFTTCQSWEVHCPPQNKRIM